MKKGIMMNRTDTAVTAFRSGKNCAQSVLASFTNETGIDLETSLRAGISFGAGMGRLQETCGAVTAAFLTIGMKLTQDNHDSETTKEEVVARIQEFETRFRASHGTLRCADLLGVDLNTEGGQSQFKNENLGESICEKCISTSVSILDELLNNSPVAQNNNNNKARAKHG